MTVEFFAIVRFLFSGSDATRAVRCGFRFLVLAGRRSVNPYRLPAYESGRVFFSRLLIGRYAAPSVLRSCLFTNCVNASPPTILGILFSQRLIGRVPASLVRNLRP